MRASPVRADARSSRHPPSETSAAPAAARPAARTTAASPAETDHSLTALPVHTAPAAAGPIQLLGWTSLGGLNPRRFLPTALGGYTPQQMAEPRNRDGSGPLDLLGSVNPRLYAPTWLGGHSHQHLAERRIRASTLPEAVKERLRGAHRAVAGAHHARRPNDLTVDQHDRLVTLLEQVHGGRSNLRIEPELAHPDYPLGNEADVRRQLVEGTLGDLVRISQTRQGRGLPAQHRTGGGRCGRRQPGGDQPLRPHGRARRLADVQGPRPAPPAAGAGALLAASRQARRPVAMAEYGARVADNSWEVPARTDVSLFHELVHASHIQTGRYLPMDDLVTADEVPHAAEVDLPAHGGQAVSREEYKTVGLGPWEDERFTDRKYRQERRLLGETCPTAPTTRTAGPTAPPGCGRG